MVVRIKKSLRKMRVSNVLGRRELKLPNTSKMDEKVLTDFE